jgi:hypothetical protein
VGCSCGAGRVGSSIWIQDTGPTGGCRSEVELKGYITVDTSLQVCTVTPITFFSEMDTLQYTNAAAINLVRLPSVDGNSTRTLNAPIRVAIC